ncbi:MAG TPA: hypothetical protein PKY81_07305 [bacterium]|nr:hypothetical protein [bacterium]
MKNEYFYRNCFDEIEIYNHLFLENNPEITEHLKICPQCREYAEILSKQGVLLTDKKYSGATAKLKNIIKDVENIKLPKPERFEPYQIWNTIISENYKLIKPEFFPKLIVITEKSKINGIIKCAAISADIQYASQRDIIISGSLSPLQYDFMIQLWLNMNILASQLHRHLGSLNDKAAEYLQKMLDKNAGFDVDISAIPTGQTTPANERIIRHIQKIESENCRYLTVPAKIFISNYHKLKSKTSALNNADIFKSTDEIKNEIENDIFQQYSDFQQPLIVGAAFTNKTNFAAAASKLIFNFKPFEHLKKYYELKRYSKLIVEIDNKLKDAPPDTELQNFFKKLIEYLKADGSFKKLNQPAIDILKKWQIL